MNAMRMLILGLAATVLLHSTDADAETTLRVVMYSDLKLIDPIWSGGYITRNHGCMIYDTLFATDAKGEIRPQMVDRYDVSGDKLTYTMTLRDGLLWHDGKPVSAEDCVASIYRQFADRECKGYSDAYYQLALAVADDDEVIRFIAPMPVIQPNLFFASIQFLTGPDDMPRAGPELRRFLTQHGAQVGDVMRSRRTQTNEVGRCAVLLPSLPPGPLAIVEVGASAGLCLLLDAFYYEFESAPVGVSSSPVRLRCRLAGPVPVPRTIPKIVWRHGLDSRPVDVRDEDAVRWLLACVWPDHHERRRLLEGAIALAKAHPPAVRAGDLVDDLPALLAEVPDDAQIVVFHSAVLSYVSADRRQAFAAVLADESKRRDVVWVSNEGQGIIPEIAALAPPSSQLRFLLGRTTFTNGRRHDELLGLAHPHGAKLTWCEARDTPAAGA